MFLVELVFWTYLRYIDLFLRNLIFFVVLRYSLCIYLGKINEQNQKYAIW